MLPVAGYIFNGDTVEGNCSYYTVASPRGGRTNHYQSCTWDLFGNLVSTTPMSSEPIAPPVLSTNGTEIIYAVLGSSSTGQDTRGFGFVSTPSAHYSWQTVNNGYADIPFAPYTIKVTLISDGDFPLVFDSANVTTSGSYYTPSGGRAAITANPCPSSVPAGSTCSLTITYHVKSIGCTTSPYGFGYTGIELSIITDSEMTTKWSERFTVTGMPICDD